MNAVELFTYRDAAVRTVLRYGEPWFVAADVCAVLDIANPRSSLALLDDDERDVHSVDTLGGPQNAIVVNEPGLYSLILRSRKPEAKAFKRWITHEVLPAIRRTGRYEVQPALPQTYAAALRELAASVDERDRLAAEVKELAPAAHSWQVLADGAGDYDLRAAAQMLSRDPAIEIGQNRLADLLRELRWVDTRSRRPYQSQIANGRLAVRIRTWTDPDTGEDRNTYQPRITPKGLEYLHKHLGGSEPLGAQLVLVEPAS